MPTPISLMYALAYMFLSSGSALTILAWYGVTPDGPAALALACGLVVTLTLAAETLIPDA